MRGQSGLSPGFSQGLTSVMRNKQMTLKSSWSREVTERKQVGDAESMVNEGASSHHGLFRGEGGEV
jgi:hypothetical protein